MKLDFDQIRTDIAGALEACMEDTTIDTVAKEQEEVVVIQKNEATPHCGCQGVSSQKS